MEIPINGDVRSHSDFFMEKITKGDKMECWCCERVGVKMQMIEVK